MGPFAIDIPAPFALELAHQQKMIEVTIGEVIKEAQVEFQPK